MLTTQRPLLVGAPSGVEPRPRFCLNTIAAHRRATSANSPTTHPTVTAELTIKASPAATHRAARQDIRSVIGSRFYSARRSPLGRTLRHIPYDAHASEGVPPASHRSSGADRGPQLSRRTLDGVGSPTEAAERGISAWSAKTHRHQPRRGDGEDLSNHSCPVPRPRAARDPPASRFARHAREMRPTTPGSKHPLFEPKRRVRLQVRRRLTVR
jgi:hypothetical protein